MMQLFDMAGRRKYLAQAQLEPLLLASGHLSRVYFRAVPVAGDFLETLGSVHDLFLPHQKALQRRRECLPVIHLIRKQ